MCDNNRYIWDDDNTVHDLTITVQHSCTEHENNEWNLILFLSLTRSVARLPQWGFLGSHTRLQHWELGPAILSLATLCAYAVRAKMQFFSERMSHYARQHTNQEWEESCVFANISSLGELKCKCFLYYTHVRIDALVNGYWMHYAEPVVVSCFVFKWRWQVLSHN